MFIKFCFFNLVAPEINISLIGEQIENKYLSIHCNIQSRPDLIKIQWFNGTNLINLTNQNRLTILLTRYMHKNQIICQGINQVGKRNQSITLEIDCNFYLFTIIQKKTNFFLDKPIFIDSNGNELKNYSVLLVNEGESIKFECLVDSFPSSFISWIFNERILSINKTSIQINNVQSNRHLGFYICSAQHRIFGIFNRTIRLALKSPPEMIEEKKIHSVDLGQSATLVCSISTDIPIQVCFFFQNDFFSIYLKSDFRMYFGYEKINQK